MSDVFKRYKVKGKFTDRVYGGLPADKELIETHLTLKGVQADDLEAADAMLRKSMELSTYNGNVDKSTNIFARDENGIFLNSYQIQGALKEAMSVQKSITSWRTKFQRGVRVAPSRIYLTKKGIPLSKADDTEQSVCHGEVMGRPTSSLKKTEYVEQPEFEFEIIVGCEKGEPILELPQIKNLLEHIEVTGIGARRTMGAGMCELKIIK